MHMPLTGQRRQMNKEIKSFIKIDNWGELEAECLIDTVNNLRKYGTWNLEKWKPTAALIDKNGKTSRQYVGQSYDTKYMDLVSDGWTHDHCEICTRTISNKDNYDDWLTEGYRNENRWVCKQCFSLFMVTDDISKELEKYQRVEK